MWRLIKEVDWLKRLAHNLGAYVDWPGLRKYGVINFIIILKHDINWEMYLLSSKTQVYDELKYHFR